MIDQSERPALAVDRENDDGVVPSIRGEEKFPVGMHFDFRRVVATGEAFRQRRDRVQVLRARHDSVVRKCCDRRLQFVDDIRKVGARINADAWSCDRSKLRHRADRLRTVFPWSRRSGRRATRRDPDQLKSRSGCREWFRSNGRADLPTFFIYARTRVLNESGSLADATVASDGKNREVSSRVSWRPGRISRSYRS